MTHTHQFQEITLTIHRYKGITYWRCIECHAVYAMRNGEEDQLPGEIVIREGIDDGSVYPAHHPHSPKWSSKDPEPEKKHPWRDYGKHD